MFTKSIAIALALATAGCAYNHHQMYNESAYHKLDFWRLEQAENDYKVARTALSAVASRLPRARRDPDRPSFAEQAAALDQRAYLALTRLRAAYDRKDAVQFEYQVGELRVAAAEMYNIAQGAGYDQR